MTCSACGWPGIRKLSLVHDMGTSSLAFDTTGTVGGLAGGHAFVGRHPHSQNTRLSQERPQGRAASENDPRGVFMTRAGSNLKCRCKGRAVSALAVRRFRALGGT